MKFLQRFKPRASKVEELIKAAIADTMPAVDPSMGVLYQSIYASAHQYYEECRKEGFKVDYNPAPAVQEWKESFQAEREELQQEQLMQNINGDDEEDDNITEFSGELVPVKGKKAYEDVFLHQLFVLLKDNAMESLRFDDEGEEAILDPRYMKILNNSVETAGQRIQDIEAYFCDPKKRAAFGLENDVMDQKSR